MGLPGPALCIQCDDRTATMTVGALGCPKSLSCTRCAGSVIRKCWSDHPDLSGAVVVPVEMAEAS